MRAKLGDLGAARFEDASLSVGLLSPQYTSPERFDVPTSAKSTNTDMYSIGVTKCELFTPVKANLLIYTSESRKAIVCEFLAQGNFAISRHHYDLILQPCNVLLFPFSKCTI